MRGVAVARSGWVSTAARTGIGEALRQGLVRSVRDVVTTSRTYPAARRVDSLRRAGSTAAVLGSDAEIASPAHTARNSRMDVPPSGTISPGRNSWPAASGASSSLDHSETNAVTPAIIGSVTSIGRSFP